METITREKLHELVWSEPITKIAPRYGLSDRGLGKLCARFGIPVPPGGYWAKKAAGKRVTQKPLPPRHQNQADTIVLSRQRLVPPPVADAEELAPAIALPSTTERLRPPMLPRRRALAQAVCKDCHAV